MDLTNYNANDFYDEMLTSDGKARRGMGYLSRYLKKLNSDILFQRRQEAEMAIRTMGITFTVYDGNEGTERIFPYRRSLSERRSDREWPYDIIPRVILNNEWKKIEKGLIQRLTALNHFINDVYNDKKIIKDKVVPRELMNSSKNYRKECE